MSRSTQPKQAAARGWFVALGLLLIVGGFSLGWLFRETDQPFPRKTRVVVAEGGHLYPFPETSAQTVGEFLAAEGIALAPEDNLFPSADTLLTSGTIVRIERAQDFSVLVEQRTERFKSRRQTVAEALEETGILLDEDDLVSPGRENALSQDIAITITRVEVSEEVKERALAFSTETREDDELSWRKKIVTQKGEPGVERSLYRVSRHDGQEVNRKLLERTVTKEPVPEIVTQGTLVKVGKSHSGGASWYAHTGTLSAANPWLPFGSFVRVTNTENGRSVIVKINDRGPFGAGRIIDLDKVAFQEIASLGTGVINVKMEEITN